MPTLSDRASIERPVYQFVDGTKCRLKNLSDLSYRQIITVSEGLEVNTVAAIAAICYDRLPPQVSWEEAVGAWVTFQDAVTAVMDAQGEKTKGSSSQNPPLDLAEVVPRLQRGYGASGDRDWMDVPTWEVEMYVDQLPALEARETLQRVQAVALGTGSMKNKLTARQAMRRLQKQAQREKDSQKQKSTSEGEHAARLAMLGFGFKKVPVPAAPAQSQSTP